VAGAVVHDESRAVFATEVEGEEAVVEYRKLEGKVLEVYRTYVPNAGRGQGLAGALMRAALYYARREDYRVLPTCSYAARFLEKHPESADLRVDPDA